MSVALTAKSKEISFKKLIRFWKTALIFVSFHISVLQLTSKLQSFGKLLGSYKPMLSLIVPNLVATSAIAQNSSIKLVLNSKNTFVMNALKYLLCVKFATRNTQEQTLEAINALKISILTNSSKMNTMLLKISLINLFFIEDKRKVLVCAPNISVLKNIEIILTNIRKAWLHKTQRTVLSNVSDAKLSSLPMKIAISAFTAMKHIALHALDIANSTTSKKWNNCFLSDQIISFVKNKKIKGKN